MSDDLTKEALAWTRRVDWEHPQLWVTPEFCELVLEGDYRKLIDAFYWRAMPEGHSYWQRREEARAGVTKQDKDNIRALMVTARLMGVKSSDF